MIFRPKGASNVVAAVCWRPFSVSMTMLPCKKPFKYIKKRFSYFGLRNLPFLHTALTPDPWPQHCLTTLVMSFSTRLCCCCCLGAISCSQVPKSSGKTETRRVETFKCSCRPQYTSLKQNNARFFLFMYDIFYCNISNICWTKHVSFPTNRYKTKTSKVIHRFCHFFLQKMC